MTDKNDGKKAIHLPIILGAATGIYAVTLAGVTIVQADHDTAMTEAKSRAGLEEVLANYDGGIDSVQDRREAPDAGYHLVVRIDLNSDVGPRMRRSPVRRMATQNAARAAVQASQGGVPPGGTPMVAVALTADRALPGRPGPGDRIRFEHLSRAPAEEARQAQRRARTAGGSGIGRAGGCDPLPSAAR